MLKALGTTSTLSVLLPGLLFYFHGETPLKGNLSNTLSHIFTLHPVVVEGYNIQINIFMVFLLLLMSAYILWRPIMWIFSAIAPFLILDAVTRNRQTYVIHQQREEYWNSDTNSIDYH